MVGEARASLSAAYRRQWTRCDSLQNSRTGYIEIERERERERERVLGFAREKYW